MSASDNTIKSFALGYKVTNAVVDGVVASTDAITSAAAETTQVSTSFFSGIMFAINERRGTVKVETQDDEAKREAAAKKLREAKELYERAHTPSKSKKATLKSVK